MKSTDFSLPDKNNKIHKLSDYQGKWVILYFYPKDDTPGCTKEACGFRDFYQEIKKINGVVIGISADNPSSHKKFAQKHNLNFILLSDIEKKVIKQYQAWGKKKFLGKEFEEILRITYLINPQGEIVKKYEKVKPEIHAKEIIEDIKKFSQ
ncbi:MAG: thioredoxin-dependent thiol peroxidase [Patescibacteria group bacterium]|nr:thioredoxin-dependent thiol peroxidase [Patescibacteria group bacterium]